MRQQLLNREDFFNYHIELIKYFFTRQKRLDESIELGILRYYPKFWYLKYQCLLIRYFEYGLSNTCRSNQ